MTLLRERLSSGGGSASARILDHERGNEIDSGKASAAEPHQILANHGSAHRPSDQHRLVHAPRRDDSGKVRRLMRDRIYRLLRGSVAARSWAAMRKSRTWWLAICGGGANITARIHAREQLRSSRVAPRMESESLAVMSSVISIAGWRPRGADPAIKGCGLLAPSSCVLCHDLRALCDTASRGTSLRSAGAALGGQAVGNFGGACRSDKPNDDTHHQWNRFTPWRPATAPAMVKTLSPSRT